MLAHRFGSTGHEPLDGAHGATEDGSGLVLGNPPEAPFQNYSDYVMPNLLVESFIDRVPTATGEIEGGTLAPTLELHLDGATSTFVREWPYGYIPAMRNVAGPPIR